MTQISLCIEDTMVGRLNEAARSRNCSVSSYVTAVLAERLFGNAVTKRPRRSMRGCLKGKVWMADDFDAPLEEMAEYM